MENYRIVMSDEFQHHGVLGQKWGVRRYQNADGTLTEAGHKKYAKLSSKFDKKVDATMTNLDSSGVNATKAKESYDANYGKKRYDYRRHSKLASAQYEAAEDHLKKAEKLRNKMSLLSENDSHADSSIDLARGAHNQASQMFVERKLGEKILTTAMVAGSTAAATTFVSGMAGAPITVVALTTGNKYKMKNPDEWDVEEKKTK